LRHSRATFTGSSPRSATRNMRLITTTYRPRRAPASKSMLRDMSASEMWRAGAKTPREKRVREYFALLPAGSLRRGKSPLRGVLYRLVSAKVGLDPSSRRGRHLDLGCARAARLTRRNAAHHLEPKIVRNRFCPRDPPDLTESLFAKKRILRFVFPARRSSLHMRIFH
jgi:hypothetical protein